MFLSWILKTIDFVIGPSICWAAARLLSLRSRCKVPAGWSPANIKTVLLIRPGGIGDMVIFMSTISAISELYPTARIDLVCENRNRDVAEMFQIKANCLPYDSAPLALAFHLIRTRYDLVIDSEQFHHFSAVFAAMSGATARIGFNINPRRNGLYTHLIPYSPDGFEGGQFLRLLNPLGFDLIGYTPQHLQIANPKSLLRPELLEIIESLSREKKLAVIHAGGSLERKLWPEAHMTRLIERLTSESGLAVIILGTRSDARRASRIKDALEADLPVASLTDRLTLQECAALISMAGLFIGPDSGLLHLAVACDTLSVGIFGPSDDRKWGYRSERHTIVRRPQPCSPCCIFGYSKPCRSYECIESITVDDVTVACRDLMSTAS